MITLDTVLLLQQKVDGAVEKIRLLNDEVKALRGERDALTNERNSLQDELSAVKEQLSSLMQNQTQIESSIMQSLDRLGTIGGQEAGTVQNDMPQDTPPQGNPAPEESQWGQTQDGQQDSAPQDYPPQGNEAQDDNQGNEAQNDMPQGAEGTGQVEDGRQDGGGEQGGQFDIF